ncbi:MAG: TldD/PmbA family protein [Defluviitaleaceae bacterium]|nr:TldD/PmbA family protein [Defluviitaleaceae bacterium]
MTHLQDSHKTCVLSPKTTAAIIHETVGHIAEADFILPCTHHSPYYHLSPISKKVTIIDYAHTAQGKPCPLPIFVDAEGTTATDVCIIKEGIPTGIMTNLYTAAALSIPATGNARAASPGDDPMVRMRNTALLPWHDNPLEIISSTQDGYYLTESGNCYGDVNGDFCCEIKKGFRIKNGQLSETITNYMIWGTTVDFLQSISMVGNDFEWYVDECTKWQTIKVAQGAPTIKANFNIGVM